MSVDVGLEALADRTQYLKELNHPTANTSRWLRHAMYEGDRWNVAHDGWRQISTFNGSLWFGVDVPHGSTITQVQMHVDPVFHASFPATPPKWSLWRVAPGSAATLIETMTNLGQTGANYSMPHSIVKSFSHGPVDHHTYRYLVECEGEFGVDSELILLVTGVRVHFNMTVLDEAGS